METYKYSPSENPLGASEGRRKVIRGGSWIARGEYAARCANRAAYEPIQAIHSVGFRIAMDVRIVVSYQLSVVGKMNWGNL